MLASMLTVSLLYLGVLQGCQSELLHMIYSILQTSNKKKRYPKVIIHAVN